MELTLYGVNIWAAALVFARIGAMISILPGFGEPSVPAPLRLAVALTVVTMLAPTLAPGMPQAPDDPWLAGAMIVNEVLIGLMIGAAARLLFAALSTAGQVIGNETGLAFAQVTDPTMSQAGQVFGVFLAVLGVALIFATETHHLFIGGMARSYDTFAPGAPVALGDAADLAVQLTGDSFRIGVQIAAPLILAGLVFRLGLGVLARLIPTIQVFFVSMPLSVLGGFAVVALGLSSGMLMWLDALQQHALNFP